MSQSSPARDVLVEICRERDFLPSQVVSAFTPPQPRFVPHYREAALRHLKKLAPEVTEGAIDSFLSSNQDQRPIESIYGSLPGFILMTDDQLKPLFQAGGRDWPEFYKKFPDSVGIVYISAPGFSDDDSQCIVEIGQQRGGLWGHGVAYLYCQAGAGWKRHGELRTWVS